LVFFFNSVWLFIFDKNQTELKMISSTPSKMAESQLSEAKSYMELF
jgi:hypothetical protein